MIFARKKSCTTSFPAFSCRVTNNKSLFEFVHNNLVGNYSEQYVLHGSFADSTLSRKSISIRSRGHWEIVQTYLSLIYIHTNIINYIYIVACTANRELINEMMRKYIWRKFIYTILRNVCTVREKITRCFSSNRKWFVCKDLLTRTFSSRIRFGRDISGENNPS